MLRMLGFTLLAVLQKVSVREDKEYMKGQEALR